MEPELSDTLLALAAVALGSAAGGAARFLVSGLVARRVGETFPWGTMTVNVTGAFALGFLAARLAGDASLFRALAATGFLGSYTTVSSLSLQTLALVRDGERARAAANVALSLLLGLGAAALGLALGGGITGGVAP